jgi:UDP-GlcNAc:undecaprenyl-phosphate GlcNAc-1-phosphate transferase
MQTIGWIAALITFLIAVSLTPFVQALALRFSFLDIPKSERKVHSIPTPLLGGVAVIVSVIIGACIASPSLVGGYLLPKHLIGLCIAALIIAIGGAIDDRRDLPAHIQILFPVLACIVIVASGIGIEYITNPLGGTLPLNQWHVVLFTYQGLPYGITLFADLFTVLWLMGMMYTTKFLDGLDGLVSGVSVIGMLIIFALSLQPYIYQPETATLALIGAAAFLGFLVWNWHPAKIFLGESGSLFAGFFLGVLSIISGAKIATALLILGVPILDVAWVIARRLFIEHRSPFAADRKHLHLRLLDAGLSHRSVVITLYVFTAVFGITGLFAESREKVIALGILLAVMFGISVWLVRNHKHRNA